MDELYKEHILDHYRNPRNKGALRHFDIKQESVNPSCGDTLVLYVLFDDSGRVKESAFEGSGCAISQAGASLLTEKIKGKSLDELKKLAKEDILEMLGIPLSPVRLKCALLSLDTFKNALVIYKKYIGDKKK